MVTAAAPSIVAGASVLSVGFGDVSAIDSASGSSVVWAQVPVTNLGSYNSAATGFLSAAPRLPAGATIWQIDAYGYATGATTQSFTLNDVDNTSGAKVAAGSASTPSGPGTVQATISFPSGTTLAVGHSWYLDAQSANSVNNMFIGAIFQYTLPTLSFVPITPARVFDSRLAPFGAAKIATGVARTINVKDGVDNLTGAVSAADAVPAGAKAVAFNFTITGTVNAGFGVLNPGTSSAVASSNINWTASGLTLANSGIVALGTGTDDRKATIVVVGASASTHVIIDITGYFR